MNIASTFPSVTNILARRVPCRCTECMIEAELGEEFGPDLSEAGTSQVETRRAELRQKAVKDRKLTGELTAYQIAKLETDGERLAAISARLEQLTDGRKAHRIDCNAFWALRDDYAALHQGIVPLPTRDEQDAMLLKFARPKKRQAA